LRTPDFLDDVRKAVWSINPNVPRQGVGPLSEFMAQSASVDAHLLALVLLGIAAGIAVILGLVGVYGVISYAVSQRTIELGMRMALGADARRVRTMVLREGSSLRWRA